MHVLTNATGMGDIIHELYLKPTHLSVEGAGSSASTGENKTFKQDKRDVSN